MYRNLEWKMFRRKFCFVPARKCKKYLTPKLFPHVSVRKRLRTIKHQWKLTEGNAVFEATVYNYKDVWAAAVGDTDVREVLPARLPTLLATSVGFTT